MKDTIEPEVNILKFRHDAKRALRSFFESQGFFEIDTPYLLASNAPDPFIDPISAIAKSGGQEIIYQLHTSPEIWLKKTLAQGFERIYHMGRVFRDDPLGRHHSREFTMLEWYRAHQKLSDLLLDCQEIFRLTFEAASKNHIHIYAQVPKLIVTDLDHLFKTLANINLPEVLKKIASGSTTYLQDLLIKNGEHLPRDPSFADAFFHIMLKYIEPNLPFDQPVAITRWPIQLAALAAPCTDDPNYCDRFEIYFRGVELANAYQECTDQDIIRARFIRENQERATLNKPVFPIDESFLRSLDQLPQSAGIAMGIDRLFLTVAQKSDLSEIILGFPEKNR